jgi:hypothetical protein
MILDGNDYKQKENNLNVEKLMEVERKVVRREIAEVSFMVNVDLVVNLEMIGLTHLKRR